jgi:hypothetical protein
VPIQYQVSNESYKAAGDGATARKTTRVINELRSRGFRNELYPPSNTKDDSLNLATATEAIFTTLLGANCAVWAVQCSLEFVYEFYRRMPIEEYARLISDRLEHLKNLEFLLG